MHRTRKFSTVNNVFDTFSHTWWKPQGPFRLLHAMNPLRIKYICQQLQTHHLSGQKNYPHHRSGDVLRGLSILDVGCGGGLLSFPLASFHPSRVLGIDLNARSVAFATEKARGFPYSELSIQFQNVSALDLPKEKLFDVVVAMEMMEHIASISEQREVFQQLLQLLAPGGMLFLSTINRSALSSLLTVHIAEKLLEIVPNGTHDPALYIKPNQIVDWTRQSNIAQVKSTQGMMYNPFNETWSAISWTGIHYMMGIQKNSSQ